MSESTATRPGSRSSTITRVLGRLANSRALVIAIVAAASVLAQMVAAGALLSPGNPALQGPAWCAVAVACGLFVFRGLPARVLGAAGVLSAGWGLVMSRSTDGLPITVAVVSGLAMVGLALGGALAILGAPAWRGLSARYSRDTERSAGAFARTRGPSTPAAASAEPSAPPAPTALWDALDRGEDPTAQGPSGLMST